MSGPSSLRDEDLVALMAGAATPDLARRLENDPEAQARLAEWRAQDAALAALLGPVLDEPVPGRMAAVLAEARGRPAPPRPWRQVAAAAVLLCLGASGGWMAARSVGMPATTAGLTVAEAALAAHRTFAVEVAHPVEVPASEADHLTRWLSKRLGHPIAAPDFAREGFRLMGGRIVPDGEATAALFMYEDDLGRRVTLFVAPKGTGGDTAFRFSEAGETQSFWWIDGDLSYAVTGAIPRETLRAIAVAAYGQLT